MEYTWGGHIMKTLYKTIGLVLIGASSIAFGMEFYLPQELMLELEMDTTKPVKPIMPVTAVAPLTVAPVVKKPLILKENKIIAHTSLCEKDTTLCLSPQRFSLKNHCKSLNVKHKNTEIKPEIKKSVSKVLPENVVIPSLNIQKTTIETVVSPGPVSPYRGLTAMLEIFKHRGMITQHEYMRLLEETCNGVPLLHLIYHKLSFKKLDVFNNVKYWNTINIRMNSVDFYKNAPKVNLLSPLSKDLLDFYEDEESKIICVIKSFLQDMNKNIKNVKTEIIEKITPREKYTASGFLDYCFENQEHNSVSEEDITDENNSWADSNVSLEHSSLDEQSSLEKSILNERVKVYNQRAASVQKAIMYFDDNNLFDDKTSLFFAEEEHVRLFIDHVIDIQKCDLFDTYNDCIDTFESGKATEDDQTRFEFYHNIIDEIIYEFMKKQPDYEYLKEMGTIMQAVGLVLPLLDKDSASCFTNLSCAKAFTASVMKKNGWICFEQFWNEYQECDVMTLSISDYDMYEKRRDIICVFVNDFFKSIRK